MRRFFGLCLFLLLVPFVLFAQKNPVIPATVTHEAYNFPLYFETNQGQSEPQYYYVAHKDGFRLELAKRYAAATVRGQNGQESVVKLTFSQSNPRAEIVPEQRMPGYVNYLVGADSKAWKTHIPLHSRVSYRQVYPGIDLTFYGESRNLEYDFKVAAGADPRQIEMQVKGANSLQVNEEGDLVVTVTNGTLLLKQPEAYQNIEGKRSRIGARFRLTRSKVGFELDPYDPSRELIIDPVLSYSTYVAGNSGSAPSSIAVGSDGSAYITGYTWNFPTKSPYQGTCNNCPNYPDLFITKLSPDGSALVYSTYLGGSSYDQPYSIAVDSGHNAIVVGRTDSNDFPTLPHMTATIQRTHGFAASLAPTGDALNWSHYIAGTDDDIATATTVDSSGNVYVTGTTDSPDFPVTAGTIAHDTPAYPNSNEFILKFSPSGAIQYSAVLPIAAQNGPYTSGSFPRGIAVSSDGSVTIAGSTGVGLVTTPGAFQTTPGNPAPSSGNAFNGFISKLDSNASSFLYSTYFGGIGGAPITALALDADGSAYVVGTSSTVPATPGAFEITPIPNDIPGFVAKFNSTGSLVYCTYLGVTAQPSGYAEMNGVAVDSVGNAYVAGFNTSSGFPVLNPLQASRASGAVIAALNPNGSSLIFSTYLSGTIEGFNSAASRASSVAVDGNGKLYVTGSAYSQDFPTTVGAYQRTVTPPPQYVSSVYPFVTKLDLSVAAPSACLTTIQGFGNVQVGSFLTRNLIVTNCGNAPLTVSSVSVTGTDAASFAALNNCSSATAPGGTCSIAITFTPSATGAANAILVLADDAPIPTQKVTLSGSGVVPTLTVPSQLTLTDVVLGTSGAAQFVLVRNSGVLPIHITGVSVTGDFAAMSQCPATLNAFATCIVKITFTPQNVGTRNGVLTIQDDAAGSPHTVSLSGNALAQYPTPVVSSLSPSSIQVGADGELVVYGSNFFPASMIRVNGVDYPTTYSSITLLATTLTADDLSHVNELRVSVVSPSPGGESNSVVLPVYAVLAVNAKWLTFDPWSRRVLASVGNTVVPIEPLTGQTGTPIAVGNTADRMDISGDGRYLYVGIDGDHAVRRVDLYNSTADQQLALGIDSLTGDTRTATDIRVKPGNSSVVAVVTARPGSPSESSLNLYGNGGLVGSFVNDVPTWYDFVSIAFDPVDSNKLYGVRENNLKGLTVLNALPTALTITSELPRPQGVGIGFPPIVAVPGQIYMNSGDVINPVDGTRLFHNEIGTTAYSVLPNPDLGLVYYLDLFGDLQTFDGNHQSVGTMGPFGYTSYSLIRFSNNQFAAIQGSSLDVRTVVLFQVSSGQPSAAASTAYPTKAVPSNAVRGSGNTPLIIVGSNFVPGATVFWKGSERTTHYIDGSHLEVKVSKADLAISGTAALTVKNPGVSVSSAVNFTVLDRAATFAPSSLSFSHVLMGSVATLPVTMTNLSANLMSVKQISVSAPFFQQNDCGTQLASGATCTIQVAYSPTSINLSSGMLSISEDQDSDNLTVPLSGTAFDISFVPSRPRRPTRPTVGVVSSVVNIPSTAPSGNTRSSILSSGLSKLSVALPGKAKPGSPLPSCQGTASLRCSVSGVNSKGVYTVLVDATDATVGEHEIRLKFSDKRGQHEDVFVSVEVKDTDEEQEGDSGNSPTDQ